MCVCLQNVDEAEQILGGPLDSGGSQVSVPFGFGVEGWAGSRRGVRHGLSRPQPMLLIGWGACLASALQHSHRPLLTPPKLILLTPPKLILLTPPKLLTPSHPRFALYHKGGLRDADEQRVVDDSLRKGAGGGGRVGAGGVV